jgi:hypothetical protein
VRDAALRQCIVVNGSCDIKANANSSSAGAAGGLLHERVTVDLEQRGRGRQRGITARVDCGAAHVLHAGQDRRVGRQQPKPFRLSSFPSRCARPRRMKRKSDVPTPWVPA